MKRYRLYLAFFYLLIFAILSSCKGRKQTTKVDPNADIRLTQNIVNGHAALLRSDYQKAISYLKQAESENPTNAEVHFRLSQTYAQQKELALAIEYAEKACVLDNHKNNWYLLHYAQLLAQNNQCESMAQVLQKHGKNIENTIGNLNDQAQLFIQCNKSELAINLWKNSKFTSETASYIIAQQKQIELLIQTSQIEEAFRLAKLNHQSYPTNGLFAQYYLLCLFKKKDKESLSKKIVELVENKKTMTHADSLWNTAISISLQSNLPLSYTLKVIGKYIDLGKFEKQTVAIENSFNNTFSNITASEKDIEELRNLVNKNHYNASLKALYALTLLNEHKPYQALPYFREIHKNAQANSYIYKQYMTALIQCGQLDELKGISIRVKELFPFDFEFNYLSVVAYYNTSSFKDWKDEVMGMSFVSEQLYWDSLINHLKWPGQSPWLALNTNKLSPIALEGLAYISLLFEPGNFYQFKDLNAKGFALQITVALAKQKKEESVEMLMSFKDKYTEIPLYCAFMYMMLNQQNRQSEAAFFKEQCNTFGLDTKLLLERYAK
jgi:tetratricopeptide (TPR) repeat protein